MASGGANLGEGCRDFDVGKIAESARFEEEEDLSLKTAFSLSSGASIEWQRARAFCILSPIRTSLLPVCWLKSCTGLFIFHR